MWALLAVGAAATFGAADFLGGVAARRASTISAVVVSQAAGLIVLALALAGLPAASPSAIDWAWGAAAGVAGGVGVAFLYHALAIGRMSVVAPLTAVCAVVVPIGAGLLLGDRLALTTAAGIMLAPIAIVLVSQAPVPEAEILPAPQTARAIRFAVAAGVSVGLFLVALQRTSASGGLWPLASARAVSITLFVAIGLVQHQAVLMRGRVMWLAISGGGLDMVANVLYVLAVRSGPLSVVATLASLYPASTVLLARATLGERLSARQLAGVVAALVAIALIVWGAGGR